jgi:hypothetical protein
VIKNALIANGWKFVEKSERSKNKSWVRAEIVQKKHSFVTHFILKNFYIFTFIKKY